MNKAAFFDIDGTIYREGLITELFKKLIVHELISEKDWISTVKPSYTLWDKRKGYYDDYLDKMIEIYVKTLKGMKHDHIIHVAKKVIEQKGHRVYRFTRSEINRHQSDGTTVIAISGSPMELVSEMANKYGFDDYRGTVYEIDRYERYTGELRPMWDKVSKKKAMMELKDKYDLDLSECSAYGDTTGDLTMLKLVGHPYAINPTRSLIEAIKSDEELSSKITIIVERKDMVYKIPLEDIDCSFQDDLK